MRPATRSGLVVIALLLLALLVVPWGSVWWAWLLNDHIYPVSFGWISWAALIGWSYYALVFFVLGFALSLVVRYGRPARSALALGAAYSVIWLMRSRYRFYDTSWAIDYFWVYGELFVPPLAALLGARSGQLWQLRHRRERVRPKRA